MKQIINNRFVGALASRLICWYIRLVHKTSSWEMIGREHFEALENTDTGFILAFWHSRLLMAPTVRTETNKRVFMLISANRDGEIITNAVKPFGIEFIRGSSANPKKTFKEKSGASALVQMISVLEQGSVVGMTPDGPRGPRQKAQIGIVRLSQMSGVPILPAAYATSKRSRLDTWDRFWLPWPFSKGVFVVGSPVHPAPETKEIDAYQNELEIALNEVTSHAERLTVPVRKNDAER